MMCARSAVECGCLQPPYAASLLALGVAVQYLPASASSVNAHGSKLPSDSGCKHPHSTALRAHCVICVFYNSSRHYCGDATAGISAPVSFTLGLKVLWM